MARIRRHIQQDGFAEALAKAHNDGWVKGFELGKQEGVSETLSNLPREQKQFIPQHGGFYLGRHMDTIGNTFSIYVEDSPIVLPYRREQLIERTFGGGRTEIPFAVQTRLSIHRELIGRDMEDTARMGGNMLTAYYVPYKPEGYLL
jgi:hypothetical protein